MHKKKFSSLVLLIPSFNELGNFKKFLIKLNKNYNILVVDDSSTDMTNEFLKVNKIPFIRNKINLGYENSLISGMQFIKKQRKYKKILTMDADGQHKEKYIDKINKIYDRKNADVVVGSRINKNRIIEKIISYFFYKKFKINDPLSGFKIYKTESLSKLNLAKIKNFFLVDLLVQLLQAKKKVFSINIKTRARKDYPRIGSTFKVNLKMLNILVNSF